MNKDIIKENGLEIPYITNESVSKNMIIFFHGLDGTAASVKPIMKTMGDKYKIVAIEQRGHAMSPMKSSRSMKVHFNDYITVIEHFKAQGYKIWLIGESMGAAYVSALSYKLLPIEGIFALSIPNKLVNIMTTSKWSQFKVQVWTAISFAFFTNYKYKADLHYEDLSNNKTLIRVSKLETIEKIRQVRETLATWKISKLSWKLIKKKTPTIPLYYFHGEDDVLVDFDKVQKAFNGKVNQELIVVPNSKHILTWEPNADVIYDKMKSLIK